MISFKKLDQQATMDAMRRIGSTLREQIRTGSAVAVEQAGKLLPIAAIEPATRGVPITLNSGEVKITLSSHDAAAVLEAFGVDEPKEKKRTTYFFETPRTTLQPKGVILRARIKKKDEAEVTVKLRGQGRDSVPEGLDAFEDYKAEREVSVGSTKPRTTLSLDAPVSVELVKQVAAGEAPIESLFSEDQKWFLQQMGVQIPWGSLETVGPIPARRWKFKSEGFEDKLTVEAWAFPSIPDLIEVSAKADPDDVTSVRDTLAARLEEIGLAPAEEQRSKTSIAIEHRDEL